MNANGGGLRNWRAEIRLTSAVLKTSDGSKNSMSLLCKDVSKKPSSVAESLCKRVPDDDLDTCMAMANGTVQLSLRILLSQDQHNHKSVRRICLIAHLYKSKHTLHSKRPATVLRLIFRTHVESHRRCAPSLNQ